MLINVNISSNFNIAFYTVLTVFIPSIYIFIFGKYSFKKLSKASSTVLSIFIDSNIIISSVFILIIMYSICRTFHGGKEYVIK